MKFPNEDSSVSSRIFGTSLLLIYRGGKSLYDVYLADFSVEFNGKRISVVVIHLS